ncbi:GNAT family N-acetyltransferase [Clostridium sp.]|uniref:GNAT family N-acetyltransferase n=1 Tax=Clostridium sp. TaxID=1506 RepID=UPI003F3FB6EB
MDKYIIKEILVGSKGYEEELKLRDEVLRKPLGLSILNDDISNEHKDLHIGIFESKNILGCLVITSINDNKVKMRQVAVNKRFRGKGIGRTLVVFTENLLKEKGYNEITLHARSEARNFYEKLGYKSSGDKFLEVGIYHIEMNKQI